MNRMKFNLYDGVRSRTIETTMERAMNIAREEVLGGASYVRLSVYVNGHYSTLGMYLPSDNPHKYEKGWPSLRIVDAEPVLPNMKPKKGKKKPNLGVSPLEG